MTRKSLSRKLAAILAGGLLFGQSAAEPGGDSGTLRRASVPPNYLLQPGDKLEIQIDSLAETEKIYQIRADGSINHPVAGEIKASGKPLKEVEKILRSRLEYSLKKPSFRIGIFSVAEIEASALGEVKNQGKFHVNAGANLLDLIALAGGPTQKADLMTATLLRDDKELPINLAPENQKELSQFRLVNGDLLILKPGKRISVLGEVREPGLYSVSFKTEDPIEDALRAAGGTKETAALNRVQLSRPSMRKPVVIDLNVRENGHIKTPLEIQDGDILTLAPNRCVVVGGVDKQGQVILTGNETLFDIISSSGTSRGKLSEVVVIRAADVEAGTDKRETYNLEEAFTDGKSIPKIPIYDGDVVFVPPVDPNPMNLMSIVTALSWARTLFAI